MIEIGKIDHIAYRTANRVETADFFENAMGYKIYEEFEIPFEDGSVAKCIALKKVLDDISLHPEIFVSDGTPNSIVGKWVEARNGIGGIHHIAYTVNDVLATMRFWQNKGWAEFTTEEPLSCPGLIQCFTKPHPLTGVIYEFLKRDGPGFCKANVEKLMLSTRDN